MKALTLTQPWATLVAIGAKRIETRSWSTSHRGTLAIHAAKRYPRWALDTCDVGPFRKALGTLDPQGLLCGYVLATALLIDVIPTEVASVFIRSGAIPRGQDCPYRGAWRNPFTVTSDELAFGDYAEGRFAWLLDDVKPLPTPIPASGRLGLWDWKGEV